MEKRSQNLNDLINCPVCGEKVSSNRLQQHLQKVHSQETEQKRVAQQIYEARKREEANQLVTCPVCKHSIKRRNLASHQQKVHNQIPDQMLKMGDGPSFSGVLASLEKTKKAKKKRRSTDVFDRGLTVSGGAFGNGKRR